MMIYIKHCIGYYIAYLVDRCSPDYEVTIEDGKCPVFKKKPSASNAASITAPYCSFLRSSSLTDLCMDVQGGMRHSGAPIILYPCNGGWNQQYTVTDQCSILSTFSLISKVERYCIDKSYTNNNLYTVDCTENSNSTITSSSTLLTFKFMTSGGEEYKKFIV